MVRNSKIIYVNFSPYENTGYILDFLVANFEYVYLFSFEHYKLSASRNANILRIYHNSKIIKNISLTKISVSHSMVFTLLPLRSALTLFQLIKYSYVLKKQFGTIDYYFTVNAYTAWIGSLLKKYNFVEKTIFWVWDYYPPSHPSPIIRIMRKLYWYFDKKATQSNQLVFLNLRLINLRKKIKLLPPNNTYKIIPIGTKPLNNTKKQKTPPYQHLVLGFIGVLKKSQGLELVFKSATTLLKSFKTVELVIIGEGPDREYWASLAHKTGIKTTFHGLLSEEIKAEQKKIHDILTTCHIGVATYIPEKSNVSYYGDPSKIKRYLSSGLPVITTNVFMFSKNLSDEKAGIIVKYSAQDFVKAVIKISKEYPEYKKNAAKLAQQYSYNKIYKQFFKL